MKRFATIFLVLAMLASMGSIAYAAVLDGYTGADTGKEITDGADSNATADVYGKYSADEEQEPVYSVNIKWEDMTFKCKIEGRLIWDPNDHKYTDVRYYTGWEPLENRENSEKNRQITVENRSNVPVKIEAKWNPETDTYNLNPAINLRSDSSDSSFIVDTAANSLDYNHMIQVYISPGSPPRDVPEKPVKIGTVTITLSAAD